MSGELAQRIDAYSALLPGAARLRLAGSGASLARWAVVSTALAPLAMLIFVIGLFPNIFLSQIKGAAERAASDFEARIETNPAPKFYEGPIKLAPRRPDAPKEH